MSDRCVRAGAAIGEFQGTRQGRCVGERGADAGRGLAPGSHAAPVRLLPAGDGDPPGTAGAFRCVVLDRQVRAPAIRLQLPGADGGRATGGIRGAGRVAGDSRLPSAAPGAQVSRPRARGDQALALWVIAVPPHLIEHTPSQSQQVPTPLIRRPGEVATARVATARRSPRKWRFQVNHGLLAPV